MNADLLSLIGIILGLAIFIAGMFKGFHILLCTLVASAVTLLLSGLGFWAGIQENYLSGFTGTYSSYFLLFFFSALFAKLLGDTGAAQSIAYKMVRLVKLFPGKEKIAAVLCVAAIQAILTLGGVSLFVVTYTVVTIGYAMFKELKVPWKLFVCSSIGSGTFTAGIFPGTPQLTNLIPMEYLGTEATAAPVLSIVCCIFSLALSIGWVVYAVRKCEKNGEGFLPTGAGITEALEGAREERVDELPLWKAIVPSLALFFILNVIKPGTVMSLLYTCIFTYLWFCLFADTRAKLNIKTACSGAVLNCNQSIVALASASAFGTVVKAVPGFAYILNSLDFLPDNPYLKVIVAVNLVAGFCGSSSNGLRLSLGLLGDRFLSYGIPAPALHRLCSISSLGLDSLPHSSAVANNYAVQRLTYKEAYINNFMFSVVFNIITAMFCALLIHLGLTF